MNIHELKEKNLKIGMCVSGGLDSKTVTKRFKEEGLDVVCFTADVGQPDEVDITDVRKKMDPCGVETVIVDVKEEMAVACFEVIKANACYDGGYWNTTGIARAVTVRGLIPEMKKRGIQVLAHGATGRGNDQMRFERYTTTLAPDMKVYAPWRDAILLKEFPGRTQMVDYLGKFGIQAIVGMKKKYSTDSNLAGLSHEAEDLESMETSMLIVEPTMGVWPKDAPDAEEVFTVRFEKGHPVALNGVDMSPLQIMLEANKIGGRNGIGLSHALENRIIGTKSRGVYEAPGMTLLAQCMQYVYQAILDRRSTVFYNQLSRLVADQIYDGRYYDPITTAAMAAINVFADKANAVVRVKLYKGNIFFDCLTDCPAMIYNEADSSMEESNGLNPVSSQGFADILDVECLALARASWIRNSIM